MSRRSVSACLAWVSSRCLSIAIRDLPVVIGIVLLASFFVVVANIVVDLLYAVLNPRVHVY